MKIHIEQFNRSFVVKTSNKNVRAALEIQLKLAESDDVDPESKMVDQVRLQLDTLNQATHFIENMLGLTAAQLKKLDEMDFDDTIDIVQHIVLRMNGMSEEDVKQALTVDAEKSVGSEPSSESVGAAQPA